MNSPIRKLPMSVRSMLCASNQINGYCNAVQELVFNSLDANATSIAVRIHIAEGSIQVIDNGFGISQTDFKSIGQNYMTSKVVDISTLKSVPDKYGYRGQSLANLVQISETLKVASRFHKSETTWEKLFENGKATRINICNIRPSTGTTVEIKGFLYNFKIRKKSVDVINELQSIKIFLENISLVHSNISISLRDDSKNEIVYKIHKNRDIFQTISTLYDIDKNNIQELQVQKKQYKVKAFIGKHDVENVRQVIFINGKALPDSNSLKMKVNGALKNHFGKDSKKTKKNVNKDETALFASRFPFYLIFITCPYFEYEFSSTVLEFKDWGQVNKLIEKLIQFYFGDICLNEPKKNQIIEISAKQGSESTRNKVQDIINKILGSQGRKPEVSSMQNGIKGRMIKRKVKTNKSTLNLFKETDLEEKINKKVNMNIMNDNQYKKIPKLPTKDTKDDLKKKMESSKIPKTIQKSVNPKKAKKISPKLKDSCKFTTKRKSINKNIVKQNNKSCNRKIDLNSLFEESVKRRCELQAQKTKEYKNKYKKNREFNADKNVLYTRSSFTNDNNNISIHKKVQELVIHEYIPKRHVGIQVDDNLNKKTFKSTYDLLQTIIKSQSLQDKQAQSIYNPNSVFIPPMCRSKHDGMYVGYPFQKSASRYNFMQTYKSDQLRSPCRNHELLTRELADISALNGDHKIITPLTRLDAGAINLESGESQNIISPLQGVSTNRHNISLAQHLNDTPTLEAGTFQSHNYDEHNVNKNRNDYHSCDKKLRNFITTNSIKNFLIQDNVAETNVFKKSRHGYSKSLRAKKYKSNLTEAINLSHYDKMNLQASYTIDFVDSNENTSLKNNFPKNILHDSTVDFTKNIESMTPLISNMFNNPDNSRTNDTWLIRKNRKTNSPNAAKLFYENSNLDQETWNFNKTYTIESQNSMGNLNRSIKVYHTNNSNAEIYQNFVSISKEEEKQAQENNEERQIVNPIEVCEAIIKDFELTADKEKEFNKSFNGEHNFLNKSKNSITSPWEVDELQNEFNDSINVIDPSSNKNIHNNSATIHTTLNNNDLEEISHHFTNSNSNMAEIKNDQIRISEVNNENATYINGKNEEVITIEDSNNNNEKNNKGAFHMKNRLYFVPKGMSPIFKECQTKNIYQYDLKEDYYQDKIYNDFMSKIQNDVQIFKPRIDEANVVATNDIMKVNSKLNKSKASLKFDGQCIKSAMVLGQADKKFIAAIIKCKPDTEEFLVLFDQHAVHERIRLEKNLADYLAESQWKSVACDEFPIKISRDEIIYLHNYREKFAQFGLQWTVLNNNEITINAIPEAILGKNPRQVDKIIKAVKNLIKDEICNMQMQRGCVSIYPKSIMELVFSEACKYAIKFGDHLSKTQCVELLSELSDCKTPFQCAHGRPAMAVITNIECNETNYKVNFKKLENFKSKMTV